MLTDGSLHPGRQRDFGATALGRYLTATLAVGVWMVLGWLAGAEANLYLLIGVPLTAGFQRWVRRRPLHELWVRDAPGFRLDRPGILLAVALAITPVVILVSGLGTGSMDPARIAWLLCAVTGAGAGGFAFRHFHRATLHALAACLATAGVIGVAVMTASWLAREGTGHLRLDAGLKWLLLYIPVTFIFEEVFFRGALDAHLHRPGEGRGWASAIFGSALWGIWHLPVVPQPGVAAVVGLLVVHTAIGVPLSLYWRRSGNLAVPAVTHALIDAVRNALLR